MVCLKLVANMATDTSGKPPPLMGATAIRPPDRVGMDKYTHILYDPKNGTVLTRTPKSWALIIGFYCIYYSCLAGFWLAAMKLFLTIQIQDPSDATLDAKPTWTLGDSIIGVNPGVGIRPMQPDEHVNSGIFTLDLDFDGAKDCKETAKIPGSKGYACRSEDFFKIYETNAKESNDKKGEGITCDGDQGYHGDKNTFCLFDRATLGGCSAFPYGYGKDDFKPCIFLKFNRIMDLEPKPIKNDTKNDASLDKDPSAQEFLKELKAANYPDKIFIKCDGDYPADKEALKGKAKMLPETPGITNAAGIPLKYFPYSKNRIGKNESPLVAIQFSGLEAKTDQLIHIICKAYYQGVVHSKKVKAGLVKFEVLLLSKEIQKLHDEA